MTTVIFVHGTGTRGSGHVQLFEQVQQALLSRNSQLTVLPCAWGDIHGYKLHAGGITIPEYRSVTGPGTLGGSVPLAEVPAASEAGVWGVLYRDPLAELRLLSLEAGATAPASPLPVQQRLDQQVERLATEPLAQSLHGSLVQAGIKAEFPRAVRRVRTDPVYAQAIAMPDNAQMLDRSAAVARATVADAIKQALTNDRVPTIALDAEVRDAVVAQVFAALTAAEPGSLGWFDPVKAKGLQLLAQVATNELRERRGPVMDQVLGFIGDILLYQGSGAAIRTLIREQVQGTAPPVVLLAHSLGGIACVDLLIAEDLRDRVDLLITVGSQAPLFYEINALHSLRYGKDTQLPGHVPPWLNVYDVQDLLSFTGAGVFPGRIQDVRIDNRQPFPYAHSAYFSNAAVYDSIAAAIQSPQSVLSP